MFQGELQKRLELLEKNLIIVSDNQLKIGEKKKEGYADLSLHVQHPCIGFCDLEHKKLQYFRNKKCADYVVYEQREDGWHMHIFEFKRTISEDSWKDEKEQFRGAMQNALAIAGFLGIEVDIKQAQVYSVYRNDKLNDYANPTQLRYQMYQKGQTVIPEDCLDWNEEKISLDFLGQREFIHNKILLDKVTGEGTYTIA